MSPPLKTGGPRSQMLARIRLEETRVAEMYERLQASALQNSERGRELRVAAGRAGWLGRKVRLWMAGRLEAKAAAQLQVLIKHRRLIKEDDGPQAGHRSARRRLDREST